MLQVNRAIAVSRRSTGTEQICHLEITQFSRFGAGFHSCPASFFSVTQGKATAYTGNSEDFPLYHSCALLLPFPRITIPY